MLDRVAVEITAVSASRKCRGHSENQDMVWHEMNHQRPVRYRVDVLQDRLVRSYVVCPMGYGKVSIP
jgi:hypothetical protein